MENKNECDIPIIPCLFGFHSKSTQNKGEEEIKVGLNSLNNHYYLIWKLSISFFLLLFFMLIFLTVIVQTAHLLQ
jgi:hypothetical protein